MSRWHNSRIWARAYHNGVYIYYTILLYWNHKHSNYSLIRSKQTWIMPQTNSRISNELNLCVSPFASFTIHLHCFDSPYLHGQKQRQIIWKRQQILDSFATGVPTKSVWSFSFFSKTKPPSLGFQMMTCESNPPETSLGSNWAHSKGGDAFDMTGGGLSRNLNTPQIPLPFPTIYSQKCWVCFFMSRLF